MTNRSSDVKVATEISPDLPVVAAAEARIGLKVGKPQQIVTQLRSKGEQELEKLTRMPQTTWMDMVKNEFLKSGTGDVPRTATEISEGGALQAYHYRVSMKPDQFKQALSIMKQLPLWRTASNTVSFDYVDGYAEVTVRPQASATTHWLKTFQTAIEFADRIGRFLQLVFEDGAEVYSAIRPISGIVLSATRERDSETSLRQKLRRSPKSHSHLRPAVVGIVTTHRTFRSRKNLSPRCARPDIDVEISYLPRKSRKDPKVISTGTIVYG